MKKVLRPGQFSTTYASDQATTVLGIYSLAKEVLHCSILRAYAKQQYCIFLLGCRRRTHINVRILYGLYPSCYDESSSTGAQEVCNVRGISSSWFLSTSDAFKKTGRQPRIIRRDAFSLIFIGGMAPAPTRARPTPAQARGTATGSSQAYQAEWWMRSTGGKPESRQISSALCLLRWLCLEVLHDGESPFQYSALIARHEICMQPLTNVTELWKKY
jgi:hypothetical protein